ncbi:MAG: hypothetical protein U0176_10040 [Bacteroidia bacterium]
MSKMAKAAGAKVVVCSSDSTDHYEKYLSHGADAVMLGEGEATLLELAKQVEEGRWEPEKILGLAYKNAAGETVVTSSVPSATWTAAATHLGHPGHRSYQQAWKRHGQFSINMATTRGCPYKCNWCAKPIYGNRYNSHSPASKADELAWLVKHFGAEHVWFRDVFQSQAARLGAENLPTRSRSAGCGFPSRSSRGQTCW